MIEQTSAFNDVGQERPTVDPLDRIDQLMALIDGARSMPMSRTNCVVDRNEMIGALEQLRGEMPAEMRVNAKLSGLSLRPRLSTRGWCR